MTAISLGKPSTVRWISLRAAALLCALFLLAPAGASRAAPASVSKDAPANASGEEPPPDDAGSSRPGPVGPGATVEGAPGAIDEPLPEIMLRPGDAPLFSLDTPVGPLEYGLGRGLEIGRTGLHVGGFTTLAFDRENGKHGSLELDGVNFLVLLEPNEFVRGFMELEIGDLFLWETNERVHSSPNATFERLYGDLRVGDPFTLRVGKYQTPVGRWNLVPAEPFVWTPIDPAFLETAFDEHQTGATILGSVHPGGGSLDYWVYGQFIDPLDPSEDPQHADYSVGGRVQYGRALEQWSVGSSFLATEIGGAWSYLGGLDFEVRFGRVLLTSELTLQQGALEDRDLWDVYLQGVFEVVPTFYGVARYERIDPSGSSQDAHLGDFGVAWVPKPYLILKASYRATDRQTEVVRRGLSLSFSFVY